MRLFSKISGQAAISIALIAATLQAPAFADDEIFGPPNMLKTQPTPFSSGPIAPASGFGRSSEPISFGGRRSLASRLKLSENSVSPRMYLPGRLVLGRAEEFIVKGKPGAWVAVAMADKNTGAKDIAGHKIRLGSDRKLVSLVRIGDTGIAQMFIETPVQGDMIGSPFFFEAAIWTKDDFSDVEIAETVTPEKSEGADNGVIVSAEFEVKKGVKFGTQQVLPPSQHSLPGSLDSNKP